MDRLQTAVFFNLWLFVWDDEIEQAGCESAGFTEGKTVQQMQREALDYMAWHMGVADPGTPEPKPVTPSMVIVREPCEWMRPRLPRGRLPPLFCRARVLYGDVCPRVRRPAPRPPA